MGWVAMRIDEGGSLGGLAKALRLDPRTSLIIANTGMSHFLVP